MTIVRVLLFSVVISYFRFSCSFIILIHTLARLQIFFCFSFIRLYTRFFICSFSSHHPPGPHVYGGAFALIFDNYNLDIHIQDLHLRTRFYFIFYFIFIRFCIGCMDTWPTPGARWRLRHLHESSHHNHILRTHLVNHPSPLKSLPPPSSMMPLEFLACNTQALRLSTIP